MSAPIIAGAEPFSAEGGSAGVLVLHGFTGTPGSVRSLAEKLAADGYTVEAPLLAGHGTSIEDMVDTTWSDWSATVEGAYQALAARRDPIVVVGLSMGGTLACWLALRHRKIKGLVLINPYLKGNEEVERGARELSQAGVELVEGIGSDIARPNVEELAYQSTPVRAVVSLFDGAAEVAAELDQLSCPILLLSSREDHLVPVASGDFVETTLGPRVERIWLERSYHVATVDWDQDVVETETRHFVKELIEEIEKAGKKA